MAVFVLNYKTHFMSFIKFNSRTALLVLFIAVIAATRVVLNFNHDISPLANFSPLGAMALFGGAYFKKQWKAFLFPLLMLFLSDVILHQTVFKQYSNGILYGGWYWVYGAFALITLAGRWILKSVTIKSFLISVLVAVIIHWIVSDIGVWYNSKIFSQDLNGFIDCLIVAIPYEWRFLSGTIIYGVALFGIFEWMQRSSKLRTAINDINYLPSRTEVKNNY
jgi:hypothetical protein